MLNRKDYQFIKCSTPTKCLLCDLFVNAVCLADEEQYETDEFDCSMFGVNGEGYFLQSLRNNTQKISNNANKK